MKRDWGGAEKAVEAVRHPLGSSGERDDFDGVFVKGSFLLLFSQELLKIDFDGSGKLGTMRSAWGKCEPDPKPAR